MTSFTRPSLFGFSSLLSFNCNSLFSISLLPAFLFLSLSLLFYINSISFPVCMYLYLFCRLSYLTSFTRTFLFGFSSLLSFNCNSLLSISFFILLYSAFFLSDYLILNSLFLFACLYIFLSSPFLSGFSHQKFPSLFLLSAFEILFFLFLSSISRFLSFLT
jgi:hypothetical protein